MISMSESNIQKLRQIKEMTGTPVSRIIEKSFEESRYYEPEL